MANYHGEYDIEFWGYRITSIDGSKTTLDEKNLLHGVTIADEFAYFARHFGKAPATVSLVIDDSDDGYTAIDTALLEKIVNLKELVLPKQVTRIDMTPALAQILHANRTLIRGAFDSFAERFAAENGLRFRPADFRFGTFGHGRGEEGGYVDMKIRRDGSAYLYEFTASEGSSAGSSFGVNNVFELPKDFYRTMTAEEIAGMLQYRQLTRSALERGELAEFLEKAKTHDAYWGNNA